jgi:hypothetical protein
MGAAATVALGLIVVQHYGIPKAAPASGDGKDESGITAATRVVSTGALSIAVLPLETYAGPARQELADAMTEAVIADLSRTKGSARHLPDVLHAVPIEPQGAAGHRT